MPVAMRLEMRRPFVTRKRSQIIFSQNETTKTKRQRRIFREFFVAFVCFALFVWNNSRNGSNMDMINEHKSRMGKLNPKYGIVCSVVKTKRKKKNNPRGHRCSVGIRSSFSPACMNGHAFSAIFHKYNHHEKDILHAVFDWHYCRVQINFLILYEPR